MKKLNIYYQTDRSPKAGTIYYPEDERTPEKRVNYMIDTLGVNPLIQAEETVDVVTACPYIVEGFIKVFPDRELKCFIDEREVEAEAVFSKMAIPMQRLAFV